MFELNSSAAFAHKYQLDWIKEPASQFNSKIGCWLQILDKSSIFGGPSNEVRKGLCSEFLAALSVYELFLKLQKTELREANIGNADLSVMELTYAISEAGDRITKFEQLYELKFKKKPQLGVTEYGKLQNVAQEVMRAAKAASVKRNIIRRKVRLVEFWLHGLNQFNEHIDGVELEFQYLQNCEPSQVQLILEVMTKDAAKLMRLPDPTANFKIETGSGFEASRSVEWTKEDFKTTIKAEAGVSYGVSLKASGEWEITGLKASFEASAFAGAKLEGSVEASVGPDGVSAKGQVEAMVGVKVKFDASMEVLGIFALELGGEAFAGALASAEFEFTATTTDGIKVKLGAEAFAGARISGSAKFEFKLAGQSILSGSAKGSLTAGIGASFKLDFEVSPMGATKFSFGAGVTVGVGTEAETEIEFDPGNLQIALNSCYYRAYYYALRSELENHAYRNYFEDLEVNEARLKKALDYFKICQAEADRQYNSAANANQRLALIKKLADDRWDRRAIPMIRPKLAALDHSKVKTNLVAPGRKRSNAVTSR